MGAAEGGSGSSEAAPRVEKTIAVLLAPTAASFCVVAGLPLIQRTALSALRSDFESVLALGGRNAQHLREVLDRDPRTRSIPIVTADVVSRVTTDRVALIPSDLLVTPATLMRIVGADWDGQPVLFHSGGADVAGHGVVLCSRPSLPAFRDVIEVGPPHPGAGRDAGVATVGLGGEICLPVPDRTAARVAEARLVAELRASTAETDGPIARLDRALSTRLSRFLVRTPLRPNHITTIGSAIGLIGAWSFARGTYGSGIAGALLFWLAVLLDGCDGEVARLKFQETRWGGLYDVVTDNLVHAAIFAGVGLGQYRGVPGWNYRALIGFLLGGLACAIGATYFCLLRHPPVKQLRPRTRRGRVRRWLLRGFEALMNRDFAYLLIPLAVMGRLGWFLWGSAVGSYVYAVALAWTYRWRDAE